MNQCSHCNSELLCNHVPSNRIYSCAKCGCPNLFASADAEGAGSKLSRKSLLYGLATALLIGLGATFLYFQLPWQAGLVGPISVLLGMFAIYFGAQALLRSRYEVFSKRSKIEAGLGTASGSCLGLVVGGIATTVVAGGFIISLSSDETSDAVRVAAAMDQTAKIDLPASVEWTPAYGKKSPFERRIEFWDNEVFKDSRNRFYLVWSNIVYTTAPGSIEQNRNRLRERGVETISGRQANRQAEEMDSAELEWTVLGEPTKVSRTQFKGQIKRENETIDLDFLIYQCLVDDENNTYCLTFLTKLPGSKVTEAEIESAFNSFEPVGVGW